MRWLRLRRPSEPALDEEIQAHFAIEMQQRLERGESSEAAEQAARREFGNVGMVKEVMRGMWTYNWLETLIQDLRYAGRVARKTPAFTAVAILTLALGIGANTAIFSIVNAALLRPLPFPDADRLVCVMSTKNGAIVGGPSTLDARDFANGSEALEGLALYDHWRKNVSAILGSSEPEEMVVGLVPGEYFQLLRIQPVLGRFFTKQETEPGRQFVAIISGSFWRTRFGGDPAVLGKTLRINAETYSVVGVIPDVIPPWMDQVSAPIAIWTPFVSDNDTTEAARGARGVFTIGRLKPGVTYAQARAQLTSVAARLAREHPLDEGIGVSLQPLADTRSGPVRPILLMLGGAVGMVLLIACANLASLLLARNSARYREIAVRAALGAGRVRLIRQLLLETMALSFLGGVAGLGLAWAAGAAFTRMNAGAAAMPYTATSSALGQFWSVAPEPRVLLFTFGVSILTALLFGLAPAFTSTRVSIADTLREGGRSGGTGKGRQHYRRALVIAEVALSMVLVVAAALLVETMIKLQRQDPGFRPDHLLLAHVYIPPARYSDSAAISRFCDEFGRRVRTLPGVVDASVTAIYPPSIRWPKMFTIDGQAVSRIADVPTATFGDVDTAFLRTLGITLESGRDFAESDTAAGAPVALVNDEFVRRYLAGRYPIGQRIRLGAPAGVLEQSPDDSNIAARSITIVGVVKNFMNAGMALPPAPQIVTLFRQQPAFNYGFKDLVVRTATNPESLATAISRELHAIDADIPLGEIRTMDTHMSSQTADRRFTTVLLGLFAALGTVLAVIGAYGVIAYLVAQRTQELGIRVALGANSRDVLWLVLRYGLSIGLAGVALGLAGAFVVRQSLTRLLFGVSASDPWILGGTAALLLLVIGTASAVPARRAMRIDPLTALRSE